MNQRAHHFCNDLSGTKQSIIIESGNRLVSGLVRTYAEGKGLLALIGNSGYLEIAVKDGSASALLHARAGDEVKIKTKPGGVS